MMLFRHLSDDVVVDAAIKDFRSYIDYLDQIESFEKHKAQIQAWIDALQAGKIPSQRTSQKACVNCNVIYPNPEIIKT